MSIEQWRKRGFVPDSDEEDEFDSQEVNEGPIKDTDEDDDLEYFSAPTSASKVPQKEAFKSQEVPVQHVHTSPSKSPEVVRHTSLELVSSPKVADRNTGEPSKQVKTDTVTDTSLSASSREPTPRPRRTTKTYGKRSSGAKPNSRNTSASHSTPQNKVEGPRPDDGMWDIPSSPAQRVGSAQRIRGRDSTPRPLNRDKAPPSPAIVNSEPSLSSPPSSSSRSLSSSPDELSVVIHRPRQPEITDDAQQNETLAKAISDSESPLSSPPSTIHSPLHMPESAPLAPMTAPQTAPGLPLPHSDIPEELLDNAAQPTRRSFRERNAIQLNPYMLEMARYQNQMKAGGLRPVRIAIEPQRHHAPENTDESQEQESFDSEAERSSSPQKIRPERHRDLEQGRDAKHHTALLRRTQSSKRRKRSHPGAWQNSRHSSNRHDKPQVVIQKNTPPKNRIDPSVFEILSSPPESGSASPATRTPRAADTGGFRFPPGFTPPPTTTTGAGSKSATPAVDEPNEDHPELASSANQDSDASQESSAALNETAEEREIRRIQRQTRGVLPASWVRLHAQQRLEQQRATQKNRHVATSRSDAKGVARKVVRKVASSELSSSRQHHGLVDFDDSDDSDDNSKSRPAANDNDDERFASDSRFENSTDQGGDLMEDNRIDYMLPTISRKQSDSHGRRSLKRPKPKESAASKERQAKKARLKRQTRLTDTSYGGRRTKQPSTPSAPRLGILDAPDVSTRPPKEQPAFLRVAARKARSRQDKGRQSPTRKFLQLGSKADTQDANQSLRDWKKGSIRQTKLAQPQTKSAKRHPRTNVSNRPRPRSNAAKTRTLHEFAAPEPDVIDLDPQSPQEQAPTVADNPSSATLAAPTNGQATGRATQPEQRGHQWMVRRNAAISSLQRRGIRPAATSLAGPAGSQRASQVMFNRSLTQLNNDYRQKQKSQHFQVSLTLDRYLSDTRSIDPAMTSQPKAFVSTSLNGGEKTSTSHTRHNRRLKKNPPTRINLESEDYVQDELDQAVSETANLFAAAQTEPVRPSFFSVGGLSNWQSSYSIDFGVTPLRDGTFFHESTFIGSGEFSRSLHTCKRDLDKDVGFSYVPVRDKTMQWGPWNDKVSSEMGSVFDMMIEAVEKSAATPTEISCAPGLASASCAYRSVVKYVMEKMSFTDPVDRTSFVNRTIALAFKVKDSMTPLIITNDCKKGDLARIASYNMVFTNQIRQVASHPLVNAGLTDEILDFINSCAQDVLSLVASAPGIAELLRLYEEIKKPALREMGLREDFPSAEAYLVTRQLLGSSDVFQGVFEDVQTDACAKRVIHNRKDVTNFETAWRGLFILLPLGEIDHHGIARRESRFKTADSNWNLIKSMVSPVLDQYGSNSATQPISYNAYCRALFQRCHRLINMWGWTDCKPILDVLYDFFANITLYNLRLEEARGSPDFLDRLDQNPSLDVRPGEPCFHTLLKIIASGLRFLSMRYDKKKIRNFAWRLLPNHGRVYPKEMPLRHEDLDALRNHHDLLCTLYWVSPENFRPRLEIIRDLVSPAKSHREACSINIRSWTRLVRFKLSTKEDAPGLEPFADWHSYFLTELRQEHSNARKEIEAQSNHGSERVSKHIIESAISQNQRQIESLLSMALEGLQTAVDLAPSLEHAYRLIAKTPFDSLLGLFNPKFARVNIIVSDTLKVIGAYARKDHPGSASTATMNTPAAAGPIDEDSQEFEYGDWAAIDEVLVQETLPSEGVEHVQNSLHPLVSRLVSNCFGEDHCPEESILERVVDCWTSIAQVLVRHGLKQWDTYLSPFGDDAWTRLRETEQTRKFAPQFLASCIKKDPKVLSDCRIQAMGMWISSLMERSLMLKFQHHLTEALLNGSPKDPLLQNLPFTKQQKSGRYSITFDDLNQRRLSLISSVLSNMREHVQQLEVSHSRDLSVTKQEYSELLQRLMAAMKENYRELGNGAAEAAQGAYVEFVHQIITFLQQLTSDIRPIDPFFTDPALFPLPSSDPRYIVAKLKRYEPKLSSKKEVQTLTMFVQSIVERAIVECQQSHLVDQLHTAMKDTYEAGRLDNPTLRATLLQSVFPSYLEQTFNTPTAWLLSWPVVQSISLVFKDLLFRMDSTDKACVSSLLRMTDAIFQSAYRAVRFVSYRTARLQDPIVLAMLGALLRMISSSLVVVDYLDRVTDATEVCVSYLRWFRDFSNALTSPINTTNPDTVLESRIAAIAPPEPPTTAAETGIPQHLVTARRLAFEDHRSYLCNWSLHEGKYYYARAGHDSKEVALGPDVNAFIDKVMSKKTFEDNAAEFIDKLTRLEMLP
ncbi:hypothetical protein N7492_005958 [Penicillium capsulatum]|uniref:Methyl methanesulfonate-sensitivity protein 22 n=1 Tax=Penicillium capsulatum TaxID=69766 RepID=A0A9W9LSF3_9EURO|nr:hypothetical protein N7492_005958 [Penicillium capsulatum]KAJ6134939.1 hypothetical protein N7512_000099 [Penicillium capsulatum]